MHWPGRLIFDRMVDMKEEFEIITISPEEELLARIAEALVPPLLPVIDAS
jgi:hypothetical protein